MPIQTIREFLKLEASSGILIIVFALLSLACANIPGLAQLYHAFLEIPIAVQLGGLVLEKNVLLAINDFLMAIFFLMVALEIKRELLQGELRGQLALPLAAAAGGVVAPAGIYAALNAGDPVAIQGWAIPAATDIAFSLGVLALLGSRVPTSLKIFLTAVAVVDDLAAIVIIAIFYSGELSHAALFHAAAGIAALVVANRLKCRNLGIYFWIGAFVWVWVLKSGVHATLAGVALGFAIPLEVKKRDGSRLPLLENLEHTLHPWVAFVIMPLFAFANAGVSFAGVTSENLLDTTRLGIGLGLVVGKPVGLLAGALVVVKLGLARLPDRASWSHLTGIGFLAGIGFTMSLFIGTLAFRGADPELGVSVRLGVLGGSAIAAVIGYTWLRATLPPPRAD